MTAQGAQTPPLLSVSDLSVEFLYMRGRWPMRRRATLKAVDQVSFEVRAGETLGIVGESGCGKSTLARAVLGLIPASAGRISWLGRDLRGLAPREFRPVRRDIQIVFQDPLASLDPRMTMREIVAEPLRWLRPELSDAETDARVRDILGRVGLLPEMLNRYVHEFSGGQCQRIGIARAMVVEPKLIVCDEPVSALDVSIRAQIINLLRELQRALGLALIFISHDLAVVRRISHRVMVLYLGRVMELAARDALFDEPRHPYTQALIASAPTLDADIERAKPQHLVRGELPSTLDSRTGCVFRTRCPRATELCARETPALEIVGGHAVACHNWTPRKDSHPTR
jgi:oligopeptide transport system ATP-binding protein